MKLTLTSAELNEAVTEGKVLMPNINIRDEVARKYGLSQSNNEVVS